MMMINRSIVDLKLYFFNEKKSLHFAPYVVPFVGEKNLEDYGVPHRKKNLTHSLRLTQRPGATSSSSLEGSYCSPLHFGLPPIKVRFVCADESQPFFCNTKKIHHLLLPRVKLNMPYNVFLKNLIIYSCTQINSHIFLDYNISNM